MNTAVCEHPGGGVVHETHAADMALADVHRTIGLALGHANGIGGSHTPLMSNDGVHLSTKKQMDMNCIS